MSRLRELVERVLAGGGQLRVWDKKLQVRAPKGALPSGLLSSLRASRDEITDYVHEQTMAEAERLLDAGGWLRIWSGLLDDSLLLVGVGDQAASSARRAHPSDVVYLLQEALDLCEGASDEMLRRVHAVKRRFGGYCLPAGQLETAEPIS